MTQLLALLRFERTKLFARPITWVPFLVLSLAVLLIVIVFHKTEFRFQRMAFQTFERPLSKGELVNGFFMAAHAMNPVFQLLIPIFIAVASGLMIAGENELGTLRASLIRPISRRSFILSKFITLCAYALLLCTFFLSIVLLEGIVNFGCGDLFTINALFNNGDRFSVVPIAEVPERFTLAALMATAGMMVLAALALLISALVDSAAMAYVLTLSCYFTALTLRSFPTLDWLYPYLFVSHMLRWQQCFYSDVRFGDIYVSLVHLAGYLIVFLSAAVLLFNEKDIHS